MNYRKIRHAYRKKINKGIFIHYKEKRREKGY